MGDRPPKMSLMDINKIFSMLQPRDDEQEDDGESEELSRAVSEDDCETLHRLLSQDRYKRLINRRSGWGVPSTPLRLAATRGCVRSLRVLLAHGAEVDGLDVKAQTPLFVAVSNGHRECVEALLDAGASPAGSIYNNCSPLLLAARDGNVDILRQLLEHGAEPNVQARLPQWAANSVSCSGPLYLAAAYGHLECFRLLLLHGADPDYNCTDQRVIAQIKEPKTLLETCLRHGCHSKFIKLLIDFGANVYLPNVPVDGPAPRSEGLELLLQARAHPKSLLSQSRLAMRRILKQPGHLPTLRELEIPTVLANYLQHQP
ncbi:ankyrin repeat and SOCS box protein 12 [Neopelma chrysocephalum]|uniref:ankyrin repeat and SOCS box protein 12 n=1 Tax=Neopelma chrysocephalum TaxID=114329 RepID=UPI000FCD439F|nr:ankyrin repeat and SOCS box protein 12 [Neopelma chrysocephalum]XP_027561284.1 ankyrin repeat and SOCS box protein 12 [Neopelma chrysocephalum]XP_027561285.1 ankyrin repeat and SOCS box protein 12 [Neopelma chrysocephalum]XP_027561286.1 ankyrin repeat and SOCS box protein 12 [Neopelma chrysocephalum]XP_027561288.1 ankyrin repeat and SOCS box protein 12 [Neopelma chrysocephalum]XP_027561289.1 ankyrin repeat and SOCS box protein 12 [Neopelma chrysocephalum]XP_027561290.1 ankyrin repeat and S